MKITLPTPNYEIKVTETKFMKTSDNIKKRQRHASLNARFVIK